MSKREELETKIVELTEKAKTQKENAVNKAEQLALKLAEEVGQWIQSTAANVTSRYSDEMMALPDGNLENIKALIRTQANGDELKKKILASKEWPHLDESGIAKNPESMVNELMNQTFSTARAGIVDNFKKFGITIQIPDMLVGKPSYNVTNAASNYLSDINQWSSALSQSYRKKQELNKLIIADKWDKA